VNVVAIMHRSWLGGAQISTLEFLELLRDRVELKALVCDTAKRDFLSYVSSLGVDIYRTSCGTMMGYPIMALRDAQKLVEWADIIWITDVEYLVAPHIKKVRRVPIVAHLRSYALVCPWWGALYGFREACLERCSLRRIIGCKQGINLEFSRIGLLSADKAFLYWLLDFVKGPLDYSKWRHLMAGVFENIDGYIAVSNTLWKIHRSHIPELANKPHAIIYNPVIEPLKYVTPNTNEPYSNYILYASGANPVKGPHLLLEAWSKVSKEYKNLKLYMVGCKDSWVERRAKNMGLSNVDFLNSFSANEHYYSMMFKAKTVIMPSIWPEPFGRIPVEANRLGVWAVISSSGGLPETIVDGVTGYVFKSGDADDLAEKIIKTLERDLDRGAIISHSYERMNPWREIEKLLRFFEGMVNDGRT